MQRRGVTGSLTPASQPRGADPLQPAGIGADGCPDPDNDGDGILDVDDLCPNNPEDLDGHQDKDGCPDR